MDLAIEEFFAILAVEVFWRTVSSSRWTRKIYRNSTSIFKEIYQGSGEKLARIGIFASYIGG